MKASKKFIPNLPRSAILNLTSAVGSQAKTLAPLPGSSYELRSQGPPSLDAQALDRCENWKHLQQGYSHCKHWSKQHAA